MATWEIMGASMTLIERETKSPAERNPAALRQAVLEVNRFCDVVTSLRYLEPPTLRSQEILDRVEAAKAIQAEEAKLRKLIDRLARPATLKEIGEAVVMLQKVIPGRADLDLSGWARFLCEDIAELKPTLYQLESVVKEARQKFRYVPTIPEVLPLFKNKCLASRAASFPPLATLIEDATHVAASRRELEAMPRHTPGIARPLNPTMAARTLADCAEMCSVPDFDPSSPKPELNAATIEVAKQIASELMAGTYNRSSPRWLRAAALHLVHEQLKGE